MSDSHPVELSAQKSPEFVLPSEEPEAIKALDEARLLDDEASRRDKVIEILVQWPDFLDAWAEIASLGRDPVETYAAFRVGYHRGLDRLRQNGWRGSGLVRWNAPHNLGFLRCLEGLGLTAQEIGETTEYERCMIFLKQLDPSYGSSKEI